MSAASSSFTVSFLPSRFASSRGVAPHLSLTSGLAPARSRASTIEVLPSAAARWRAVLFFGFILDLFFFSCEFEKGKRGLERQRKKKKIKKKQTHLAS